MRQLLALFAFIGFMFSLAVHLMAITGVDVATLIPGVWFLHLGIFIVFAPIIYENRGVLKRKSSFADFRMRFSNWTVLLGGFLFAYALINFLIFTLSTHGSAAIRDGRFILQDHGRLIREITAAEYTASKAGVVRGFSGHWMLFYYVSLIYFFPIKKKLLP